MDEVGTPTLGAAVFAAFKVVLAVGFIAVTLYICC